ncbi:hydroxyproline dehydrogenase-like [Clytia hemisphaerica]
MLRTRVYKSILQWSSRDVQFMLGSSSTTRHLNQTSNQKSSSIVQAENDGPVLLDFENSRPFRQQTMKQLMRSWTILKLCSHNFIVDNAEKFFLLGRRVVPSSLFQRIMASTFYGHFTAGSDAQSSKPTIHALHEAGIKTMLMIPIENVFEDAKEKEKAFADNFQSILGCVEMIAELEPRGFSQLKITSLEDIKLYKELNRHLIDFETDHKEPGDWDIGKVASLVKEKKFQELTFSDLSEADSKSFQTLLQRVDAICQAGQEKDIHVMIDAEQTYIQAALGYIILVMQAVYNQNKCSVFNTYQCYRKDTLDKVKADQALGERLSFKIAGKFVRGAYMIEERALAKKNGAEDPINQSYEKTGEMYHACVDYVLPKIKKKDAFFMFATHNEESVEYVTKQLTIHDIDIQEENYCFGQIYGMCDHVSFTLGRYGYRIFKSVPVGTIDDTLLYLTRRAMENKSVLWRTKKERLIILEELKQRGKGNR